MDEFVRKAGNEANRRRGRARADYVLGLVEQGRTVAEIATIIGVSERSVRPIISRYRRRLRQPTTEETP